MKASLLHMLESSIYTSNYYKEMEAPSAKAAAARIVPIVNNILPDIKSVLDVGCGTGHFLKTFQDSGVEDILGVDGDYVPRDQLVIPQDKFSPADLDITEPFDLNRAFDLTVCLEVAEHLPEVSGGPIVQSLIRHAPVVLFSAAIPGQGGDGHVNCQWQSYWADLFFKLGYGVIDIIRPMIWVDKSVAWWYRQNILMYASRERFPTALEPYHELDRIHPESGIRCLP